MLKKKASDAQNLQISLVHVAQDFLWISRLLFFPLCPLIRAMDWVERGDPPPLWKQSRKSDHSKGIHAAVCCGLAPCAKSGLHLGFDLPHDSLAMHALIVNAIYWFFF